MPIGRGESRGPDRSSDLPMDTAVPETARLCFLQGCHPGCRAASLSSVSPQLPPPASCLIFLLQAAARVPSHQGLGLLTFLCDSASGNPPCGSWWFRIKPDTLLWLLRPRGAGPGLLPYSHFLPLPQMASNPATPSFLQPLQTHQSCLCHLQPLPWASHREPPLTRRCRFWEAFELPETVPLLCAPTAPSQHLCPSVSM